MTRRLTLLGSTGSIGTQTLAVLREAGSPAPFEVYALAAGSDAAGLGAQALEFRPQIAAIADEREAATLRDALAGTGIEVVAGSDAITDLAAEPVDLVVGAIVGAAGLASTLSAVRAGNSIALANKESIVCGGRLILEEAEASGARILPVDSEHNAIFQVWDSGKSVESLTITASGGPFRTWTRERMAEATPDEAAAHPNWDMGVKNSIDSATLMNKALEFIEAAYLFGMDPDRIDVLVHPQSIVHGMAHYTDGSVLAQLGTPDMRTPIAHALAWPDRMATRVDRLSLAALGALDFEEVDAARFPAIGLARAALRSGNGAATVLNRVNEEAVAAFLAGRIGFLGISEAVDRTLEALAAGPMARQSCRTLSEIEAFDAEGRRLAEAALGA